jgi:hypothetical protein
MQHLCYGLKRFKSSFDLYELTQSAKCASPARPLLVDAPGRTFGNRHFENITMPGILEDADMHVQLVLIRRVIRVSLSRNCAGKASLMEHGTSHRLATATRRDGLFGNRSDRNS